MPVTDGTIIMPRTDVAAGIPDLRAYQFKASTLVPSAPVGQFTLLDIDGYQCWDAFTYTFTGTAIGMKALFLAATGQPFPTNAKGAVLRLTVNPILVSTSMSPGSDFNSAGYAMNGNEWQWSPSDSIPFGRVG